MKKSAAVLPRFFLLVCSFPRLLFPSSAFPPRPSNCFSTTIKLLHNHFPNHPTTTFQPRLNHNPTKRNGRVRFAALLSAPSSSFRPSDRKPLVRALTVLVLSIIHPSFQPRLNHGKMLHKHFPSIQQPRSNHEPTILRVEYKNDTISTKPSYISDSTTPTNTQKQFNLNHIKEGAANLPLETKFATLVIRQRIW